MGLPDGWIVRDATVSRIVRTLALNLPAPKTASNQRREFAAVSGPASLLDKWRNAIATW